MKVRLMLQILLKGKPNTSRLIYKEFETNIIPHKGDFVSDGFLFKDSDGYEVVSVTIDYQNDICHVMLHCVELETDEEDAVRRQIEIATKFHKWKCDVL